MARISANEHAIALTVDGIPYAWGDNGNGVLGDNTTTDKSSPVLVVGSHIFNRVSAGRDHSVALKPDNTAWAWGRNFSGQLGDNTRTHRSSPVSVVGAFLFDDISAGTVFTLALQSNAAWAWGSNGAGQIGDNTQTSRSSPVSVVGGFLFDAISAGGSFAMGILSADGSLWTWGFNNLGQLGDSTTTTKSSPVSVVGAHLFEQISGGASFWLGLKGDGTAWSCGRNTDGRLGDGTVTGRSSPVSVVGNHLFVRISAGNLGNEGGSPPESHAAALKIDGSAWTWGAGGSGALGDNTTTNKSSPVSVVGNHSFVEIFAGAGFTLGLKNDTCALWAWGFNDDGALGDNTTTSKSSPVLVVGDFNWCPTARGQIMFIRAA